MYITREGLPALKRKQKVLKTDNKGLQFRHQLFKMWIVQSTWYSFINNYPVDEYLETPTDQLVNNVLSRG